jgi:hypothetical protein
VKSSAETLRPPAPRNRSTSQFFVPDLGATTEPGPKNRDALTGILFFVSDPGRATGSRTKNGAEGSGDQQRPRTGGRGS